MSNTLTPAPDLSLAEKRKLLAELLREKASKPKSFPVSFAQQRLWFLDQLEPGSPFYNIPLTERVTGPINVAALEQSVNEIVRRHDALRTTFALADAGPVQVIVPSLHMPLPLTDLEYLPPSEREQEARRLATEEAQRPFDLEQGPLVRASLLRLSEEDHVLLLNMHHIISDGWSLGVLVRELATLYEAFSNGKPSPLPELPIQYADYAVWQRDLLKGEALEKQLAYWKRQLSGSPAVLDLPGDRPRPAVQSYRGAKERLVLSTKLSEGVKALSRREGVTLFMTLLAGLQTLLHRYTNQDNIPIGSPIAGRTRAETEGLIGFFVNTLVLSTDLSGDPTFRELLGRVREVSLGAFAHQDLPFEKLVEEVQPERTLSHAPLFQVMFVHHNVPRPAMKLAGLNLSPLGSDSGNAKFDLTLLIIEEPQGLLGWLEYNTDLFDASTIRRMLGHFEVLLEAAVANPEQRLSQLPLLTEAERRQLLVGWNDTAAEYPADKCVHDLFEAQVERTPDAVAVIFEGKQLTYQDLNQRANQLAHYLRGLGVGPDVRVGICVERSLEMVVGLLGILKAGGAYVPLDPQYPEDRLRFMMEDAQAAVLITQKHLAGSVSAGGAKVVCVDTDWAQIAEGSTLNMVSGAGAEHLAYVIYTSGSTGRPKGVSLPHAALVNLLAWHFSTMSTAARTMQFASLSFDASFHEMFAAWGTGGTLFIIPEQLRPDVAGLSRFIQKQRIEKMILPVVVLQQMAESYRNAPEVFSSVREITTTGEQLHVTTPIKELFSKLRDCAFHNHYGPSESHVVTAYTLTGATDEWAAFPPIGRPIWNTQIYILDRKMNPVPVGVAGELYIGGVCLARGYLNRPELTAERFIPNPFGGKAGERLYKTGDLARHLPTGDIEYLGRIDNQVKIRGFRIELGEVEAVLGEHPAVHVAVVMAREDTPGEKRLVAYLVAATQASAPTVSELRNYMKARLPEYMTPAAFVMLETLPLTPNGKVDRRALLAPDEARPELEASYIAPRDELELQLTKIWEKVLDIKPIGVSDNFFDLGGHSLLAVRLFAQIEKAFSRHLPLATLFQAPTVEQLASIVRQEGWVASWSSLVAIQPQGTKPPFFCVHAVGANVLNYRLLAQHLGQDQPVYGLQSQGLDGRAEPHTRVDEMAEHYIKEIRTVQPEGPYYLAGSSSGGYVAFEMAQRLHAQGEKVALLALLDSYCPGPNALKHLPARTLFQSKIYRFVWRADLHLGTLLMSPVKEQVAYILGRPKRLMIKFGRKIKKIISKYHEDIEDPLTRTIRRVREANYQAHRYYVPQPYPGRVTLFWANGTARRAAHDNRLDWDEMAEGGLEVHVIPGDHVTMLKEPCVKVLTEKLGACLRRTQAEAEAK